MITNSRYFNNYINSISDKLEKYQKPVYFSNAGKILNYAPENISRNFNSIFKCFPFQVVDKSELVEVSKYTFGMFNLIYDISMDGEHLDRASVAAIKELNESRDKTESSTYQIIDFLEEYFHHLVFNYSEVLCETKKLHFFDAIEDEKVILLNLRNLYSQVLKDKESQIQIFHGTSLTKEISDEVTKALIDFIERRLETINPEYIHTSTINSVSYIPLKKVGISWLGSQQNLCELFLELQAKNWIDDIYEGSLKAKTRSIADLFDLEFTKRTNESDTTNSLYQKLKGQITDGKRAYPFLDKSSYRSNFNSISQNSI